MTFLSLGKRLSCFITSASIACALHAQTDNVFINEEGNNPSRDPGIHPNQVSEARSAKTSRPAELDPEGNWGTPVCGLQLSVRLDKNEFTNGEPIKVTTIVRNVSRWPTSFQYSKQEIVVRDPDGKELRENRTTKFLESWPNVHRGPDWEMHVHPQMQWLRKTTLSTNLDFPQNADLSIQLIQRLPIPCHKDTNRIESGIAKFRIVSNTNESRALDSK